MASAMLRRWVQVMGGTVNAISYGLGQIANLSTRRSKTVLAVWFACILLCFLGVLRFNNITDSDKLWVDPHGAGTRHQELVDAHFNASAIYTLAFVTESRMTTGADIVTLQDVTELFAFKDALFALTTPTRGVSVASLCVRRPDDVNQCIVTGVMNFWDVNGTEFSSLASSDTDVKTQVASQVYPDGSEVNREMQFSAFLVESGHASATAFSYVVALRDPETAEESADIAELVTLVEELVNDEQWIRLRHSFFYNDAVDDALSSTISKDIVLMIIAYVLMIVFTQIMLGRPFSQLEGRALLAIAAVLLIVLATLGAFGLCMAFGVPFTTLQQVLPFLLVGVGIDNSFVVLSALDRIDRKLPLEMRTQMAMERVGMNITITSFVDVVALLLALVSKLPAVQYFGVYAAVSILLIYIAFITSFIALVAMDERRRERAKMDCFVCVNIRPKPSTSYAESTPKDTAMDKIDTFLTDYYAPFLLRTPIRIMVLLLFGALTGYMVYATTRIGTDFRVKDLTPEDSAVYDYITTHERLFHGLSFPASSISLYITDVNYTDGLIQSEIRGAVSKTLELNCIRSDGPHADWHSVFTAWATAVPPFNTFARDSSNTFLVGDGFYQALQSFLSLPQFHFLFKDQLAIENGTIKLSQVPFTTQYLVTAEEQVTALKELERTAAEFPFAPRAFYHNEQESFWEQKSLMQEEATFLFSLTIVSVAFVCALGLVHPVSVLIMVVILGMIFVNLLGALSILGIDLNSISVVNLVMAIGLVVDATAHIVRAFGIQDVELSKKEKVTLALGELGTPILLGAFTIILGVLPLAGASSEVFRIFFKCFLAIVILGWSHGLILLPVVLSFVGPNIGVSKSKVAVVESI